MNKSANSIFIIVFILSAIGLVMVLSSSFITAEMNSKTNNGYIYFQRQLTWLLVSLAAVLVLSRIDYHVWGRLHKVIIGLAIFGLVCALVPHVGTELNGARRWLRIAGIGVQPSEFAKLAAVIFLAGFISSNPAKIKTFKYGFIPIAIVIGMVCGLIAMAPDVGTAFFIFTICIALAITGGMRVWHMVPAAAVILPAVLYFLITRFEHVQSRLLVFVNPDADPLGKGHQIKQSLIALGSGGWFGTGLGMSKQKLFFLPEEFTDFIFAVIGEELGFIGCLGIMALFALLLWHCRKVILRAPDTLGFFIALGITLLIGLQTIMNIAVVTASMPTKGISLPFLSYGGSNIFFLMCCIGILLNIAKQEKEQIQDVKS